MERILETVAAGRIGVRQYGAFARRRSCAAYHQVFGPCDAGASATGVVPDPDDAAATGTAVDNPVSWNERWAHIRSASPNMDASTPGI